MWGEAPEVGKRRPFPKAWPKPSEALQKGSNPFEALLHCRKGKIHLVFLGPAALKDVIKHICIVTTLTYKLIITILRRIAMPVGSSVIPWHVGWCGLQGAWGSMVAWCDLRGV